VKREYGDRPFSKPGGVVTQHRLTFRPVRDFSTGVSAATWHVLAVLSIVLLAVTLRVYRLEDVDLRFDAASALQQARGIADGEWLAFARYSGSVIAHPPLFLYLMAAPYLVARDYLVAVVFHVMLDVCAIPVVYAAAVRQRWPAAALIGALLLASGPWSVQFARNTGIVAPPVFAALCLWGLLEGVSRRNRWGWALASVSAALAACSHLSGAYLIAVVCAVAVLWWRAANWRALGSGLAPLAIIGAAYLMAQSQPVLTLAQSALNPTGAPIAPTLQPLAIDFALWTSGGMHLADLTGPSYGEWIKDPLASLGWIDSVQVGLLLAGVIVSLIAVFADTRSAYRSGGILAVTWLVPVALQIVGTRQPAIHYMIPILPAAALLMGLAAQAAVDFVQKRKGRAALVLLVTGAVAMLAIVAWQVHVTIRFAQFSADHAVAIRPARPLLALVSSAKHSLQHRPDEDVIIIVNGDDLPWDEAVVTADVALSGVPHRFLNSNNEGTVLRAGGGHYLFLPGTDVARSRLMTLTGMPVSAQSVSQLGQVYHYVISGQPTNDFAATAPAAWQHGLTLQSYRWTRHSDHATLELAFHVSAAPPPNADYHWFHQIFAGGNAITQVDMQGVHPHYWRQGDLIIQRAVLPVTADAVLASPVVARVGSYAFPPNGTRERVTLSHGKVTDSVDVLLVP
jgi:hypothetical protein